jgi:WD40 repeat protein
MRRFKFWVIFLTCFLSIITISPIGISQPSRQVPEDPSSPVVVPTFPAASPWQDINMLHSLKAHWGPVYSLTFSRDGNFLASGGGEIDNKIQLWNPATGKRKRIIKAHRIRVLGLAFTPDSRSIASGSDDTTINFWNVKDGEISRRFIDPVSNVLSLAITPDGQTLISGGLEGIRLWEVKTQRLLYTLVPVAQPIVYSVATSPNQPLLASGGQAGTLQLWSIRTGQFIGTINAHRGGITSVAFSPDGESVVTGSYDHTVKVWNLSTRTSITLAGHNNVVNAVAVNPDGRTLASAGRDGVKIWDLRTGREIGSIPGFSDWVQSLAFSPDGKLLATGGFDGTIRIWQGVY